MFYVIRIETDHNYKVVIEDEHEIITTIAGGLSKSQAVQILHFLNGGSLVPLAFIEEILDF